MGLRKNILLLINPKARSGTVRSEEIASALQEEGHTVILPPIEGDWRKCIKDHRDYVDLVLLGGGDGTINYVLSVLVETQLPFVLLPLGTANLLARSFEITPDVQKLLSVIREGVPVPIDLGVVNGIYFINVCGLGVSTEVNKSVPAKLKKLTGPFSFWIHGMKVINNLNPFKIRLTVDDQSPVTIKTWQITICNGRKYAAWMTIQPDASYDDGLLRCLSTEIKRWWQGIHLLPCYIKGSYRDDIDISFMKGKKIKIESRRPLSIDVDGDVQTSTPALFEVQPKALRMLLPPETIVKKDTPIHRQVDAPSY